MTAKVVMDNRDGGPEGVIDEVEKLAPAGFSNINEVMTYKDREALVKGYAATAGFKDVKIDRIST